jgi:predicted lipoprotein with Yx(FWY)xxD motif
MKKNTWILSGIVLIVIIIVGGYVVLHKTTKTAMTSSDSTTTTTKTPTASSTEIIQPETENGVGAYLADSNRNALYTYGADTAGVSNCSGSCVASWPIYKATVASASLPANVTVIIRSDGMKQYAYKGMPLYTFTGDTPGKVTGNGVFNFSIAKP